MQVLLVEDNPGDVVLVRQALRTSAVDADLLVAYDGDQGAKLLASQTFDLVILDLNLPKTDGHTLLERYAMLEGAPAIVVFSSSRRETDRQQAIILGAREYIVKPTHLDEFLEAVQGILRRWSHQEQATKNKQAGAE